LTIAPAAPGARVSLWCARSAWSIRRARDRAETTGGVIGAGGEISWPKPTRPGDVLRVESEVIEIRPSRSRADRGTAIVRSDTRNQQGEVVQTLIARLVVPRRSRIEGY
jgi:acyl dehydratase